MTFRTLALAFTALTTVVVAGSYAVSGWSGSAEATLAPPPVTSEFELLDQTGRTVRDEDFHMGGLETNSPNSPNPPHPPAPADAHPRTESGRPFDGCSDEPDPDDDDALDPTVPVTL